MTLQYRKAKTVQTLLAPVRAAKLKPMSEVEIILLTHVFLLILMKMNEKKKKKESVLATYRAGLSISENWLL